MNPCGWWPPGPDWLPFAPMSGFRALASGVVASNYDASKSLYDALFGAVGLPGTGREDATNYGGVLVLSPAQESGPTTNASIILFVDSPDTADRAYDAALAAGGEAYDGGEGSPPPDYHWQCLRDLDQNVVYIVAQRANEPS
jgi:hypothetical protein